MRYVQFSAVQSFVEDLLLERDCWTSIFDVSDSAGEFSSKFLWETCFGKDCADSFADCPVRSFRNIVLLWCIWRCFFVVYSKLLTEFRHLLSIFSSTVRSNGLDSTF